MVPTVIPVQRRAAKAGQVDRDGRTIVGVPDSPPISTPAIQLSSPTVHTALLLALNRGPAARHPQARRSKMAAHSHRQTEGDAATAVGNPTLLVVQVEVVSLKRANRMERRGLAAGRVVYSTRLDKGPTTAIHFVSETPELVTATRLATAIVVCAIVTDSYSPALVV